MVVRALRPVAAAGLSSVVTADLAGDAKDGFAAALGHRPGDGIPGPSDVRPNSLFSLLMGSGTTGVLLSEGLGACFPSKGEMGEGVKTLPSLPHLIGCAPAGANFQMPMGSPRFEFLPLIPRSLRKELQRRE